MSSLFNFVSTCISYIPVVSQLKCKMDAKFKEKQERELEQLQQQNELRDLFQQHLEREIQRELEMKQQHQEPLPEPVAEPVAVESPPPPPLEESTTSLSEPLIATMAATSSFIFVQNISPMECFLKSGHLSALPILCHFSKFGQCSLIPKINGINHQLIDHDTFSMCIKFFSINCANRAIAAGVQHKIKIDGVSLFVEVSSPQD